MAQVTLSHVEKIYKGNVNAVHDLSLDIKDGEFLVIIGPSGCGKSTLLRMIAGLEEVNAGDILINGRYVNTIPPKDRNIAMVSQSYALYPHMTVYQNMAFGLEVKKLPPDEIDMQVHRAAKLLELENLLTRKPKTLSGGQLQRVALGRAIVREPDVFLLDEPLSNLDEKFRVNMRLQISRIHRKLGTTFVFVTHDQIEAMTMADRIVVMKDGMIQQVGTPREVYYHPENEFVAGFIGQPQMKFFDTVLTKEEGHYQVSFNGHKIRLSSVLSSDDSAVLDTYVNRSLLLGLRPEAVCPDPDFFAAHPGNRFFGTVTEVVSLGADVYVSLDCNGNTISAHAASDCPLQKGMTAEFAVDETLLHLFDPETRESICKIN